MYRPRKYKRAARDNEADIQAQFETLVSVQPAAAGSPLIFASPHSGDAYPALWLEQCKATKAQLRSVEDIWVDDLFEVAPACGAAFVQAHFPRSYLDVNRSADERPDYLLAQGAEISARVAAGLGVLPTAIAPDCLIYDRPPSAKAVQMRIDACHTPYHAALRDCVDGAINRHGRAILIDCHSMPGFGPMRARRPDFILGDRHGKSCAPDLIDAVQDFLTAKDYSVTRNHPYAGGYTTAHYGAPDAGVHALQIEINRDLYVHPASLTRKPGYADLKRDLSELTAFLAGGYSQQSLAAE